MEKAKLRPSDKRKRERNDDPSDVDGYLGPWANYKGQILVAKPTDEQKREIDQLLVKKRGRGRFNATEDVNNTTLHIENPYDYMGRSFLHIPQDVGVNLHSEEPLEKCFIPKKCIHSFTGHTKGIQKMQLFPISGHLFLTCSMDSKVKVI
jgi:pre-mRNA-processing factor 17